MIIVIVHVLVRITNATRTKLHLMPLTRIQREKREEKKNSCSYYSFAIDFIKIYRLGTMK